MLNQHSMEKMAFVINDCSGANRVNIDNSIATSQIPLSYTLTKSEKWIYCNYPEALTNNVFGDTGYGNKCLNQVTVPAGTHRIFFSYQYNTAASDTATTPFNFGIQVFNPNTSSITFTNIKRGYGTNLSTDYGSWPGVAGKSFVDYFASSQQSAQTIASNGSLWTVKKAVPNYSGLISGSLMFSITSTAIITVYIYKTLSNINGTATPVNKSGTTGQYSGYANGSTYISGEITLTASDMSSTGKYFLTNYANVGSLTVNGTSTVSDLLPITLANPSGTTVTPPANLGNWGLIYEFPLKLVNNTSTAKTFNGYVKTDTNACPEYIVINNTSTTKYTDPALQGSTSGYYNSWRWLTQSVPANSTVSGTYRYVLGTNSCASKRHVFTIT